MADLVADGVDEPARRLAIRIRGQVQGVGFRPFVYRLAHDLRLGGWVRNDAAGVAIEAQGPATALERFLAALRQPPPLARIDEVRTATLPTSGGVEGFVIHASQAGPALAEITPDVAVCAACLAELFDPTDRRYRYPFINCTHCGPRYTITRALPYDRPNTSMAGFPLCPDCAREYHDPADRRFHAQPVACPVCGPRLSLRDAQGRLVAVADAVAATLGRLQDGAIMALKGLGGFHLACDARNAAAVARLRQRKQREAKPFAVMAANLTSLAPWVECNEPEQRLLEAPERPIVLLRQRAGVDAALAGVAPGMDRLGAILPYTPLHYLLFHQAAGRPDGDGWLGRPWPLLLVMTSANPGGEPLVIDDGEAFARLAGIADGFLTHDRAIVARCDDSVRFWRPSGAAFVRRARGEVPRRIALPASGPPVLACGGWLKNTLCLTRDAQAYLSPHIGDLDNAAACHALEEMAGRLLDTLRIAPERVACDRHPDFYSSRFAAAFAAERGLPRVTVQHHHAHIAAIAAEHGLNRPVLGLALDGVGLGDDGGHWGGELLRVDGASCRRLGSLRPLPLPGGDRAAREPWRMAAAVLHVLGRGEEIPRRWPGPLAEPVRRLLERNGDVHCPLTSSAGRLFDAVAALLGVRRISNYEGQAAMALEALAGSHGPTEPLADGYRLTEDGQLDLLPLLVWLADRATEPALGAARFHVTLALALADWVAHAARREGVTDIALSGGCFLNRLLSVQARDRLEQNHLRVHEALQAPPNDGGLSLGQAWIAMQVSI
ncbi:MAG: carbamoyltransferase HypF [Candidatus Contendobacter sp.]|nr:carbamoyltransferase HypF [Candidatus Contendobacter sp.]MDG4558574.1 carbamoyltransferase HypF [Candidatus Contendobacter sp.]